MVRGAHPTKIYRPYEAITRGPRSMARLIFVGDQLLQSRPWRSRRLAGGPSGPFLGGGSSDPKVATSWAGKCSRKNFPGFPSPHFHAIFGMGPVVSGIR